MTGHATFKSQRRVDTDDEIDKVVTKALLREADERLPTGARLLEGEWLDTSRFAEVLQAKRRIARRAAVESMALWALVAGLGLAFVGLAMLLA